MAEKTNINITLDEENKDWLDRNTDNRSGFINKLVSAAREQGGLRSEVHTQFKINELEIDAEAYRKKLEATEEIIKEMKASQTTADERWQQTYEQAFDILHEKIDIHPPELDIEPDYQQALEYWAEELDMEPEALEAQIRDDLETN